MILFLGIQCLYQGDKGFNRIGQLDKSNAAFLNTPVLPIEQPRTVNDNMKFGDNAGKSFQLKPYENHKFKNFIKHKIQDNSFLSSDDRHYNPYESVEFKHRSNVDSKYDGDKKYYEIGDNNNHRELNKNFDNSKIYKKFRDSFENKYENNDGRYGYKRERYSKALKEDKRDEERHYDRISKKNFYKNKKASEFFKKHFKYDKEYENIKRIKRDADSSESIDDEDYGPDEEAEMSEENKSDVSLGSVEKQIFAHFLAESVAKDDDSHPFKDTIEVELKEKSDEDGVLVPVVEEKITKTMAYRSCGEGDDSCSWKPRRSDNTRTLHAEKQAASARKIQDNHAEHIDIETWLKSFEDDIINTGVDVKYHHQ